MESIRSTRERNAEPATDMEIWIAGQESIRKELIRKIQEYKDRHMHRERRTRLNDSVSLNSQVSGRPYFINRLRQRQINRSPTLAQQFEQLQLSPPLQQQSHQNMPQQIIMQQQEEQMMFRDT